MATSLASGGFMNRETRRSIRQNTVVGSCQACFHRRSELNAFPLSLFRRGRLGRLPRIPWQDAGAEALISINSSLAQLLANHPIHTHGFSTLWRMQGVSKLLSKLRTASKIFGL